MKRVLIFLLLFPLCLCGCGQTANSADNLAGHTFVWENGGFGGDFTIALKKDGGFTYSTGPLSSYFGVGDWEIKDGIIVLSETENGNTFRFKAEKDKLIFISEGSSDFKGLQVKDGDKFTKNGRFADESS